MKVFDALLLKLGYVSIGKHQSELSACEELLLGVEQEKGGLAAILEDLKLENGDLRQKYSVTSEALEYALHAATESSRLRETLETVLKKKGVDVSYLFNKPPKFDPSRLVTSANLVRAIDSIPEIGVIRYEGGIFAYNVLMGKGVPLPQGKFNGSKVLEVFERLGIQDRLNGYNESTRKS